MNSRIIDELNSKYVITHSKEPYPRRFWKSESDYHDALEKGQLKDQLGWATALDLDAFEVYINVSKLSSNNNLLDAVRLHEYGHIYYNHLHNLDIKIEDIKNLIETYSSSIKKQIGLHCKLSEEKCKSVYEKITKDDGLVAFILNLAGDFQINSTLFTKPELDQLISELKVLLKDPKVEFMHPSKLGIVEVNDFSYYVEQTIYNIGKLFKFMVANSKKNSFSRNNQNNNGTQDKDNSNQSDSSNNKKDDSDELDLSMAVKKEKSDDEYLSEMGEDEIAASIGKLIGDSVKTSSIKLPKVDSEDVLMKEVLKSMQKSFLKTYKRDLTYKYNRGISREVIVPTIKSRIHPVESFLITYLLDVSGSMDKNLIARIISDVHNYHKLSASEVKYEIITWNTSLSQHLKDLTSKSSPEFKIGGGTRIARSFEYIVKSGYDKSVIIIISDFEDDLNQWKQEEKLFSGRKVLAINYGTKVDVEFKNIKVIQK